MCPRCQKKVTNRIKGVEWEAGLNWYQLGYGIISEPEYADNTETVWYCMSCQNNRMQIGM